MNARPKTSEFRTDTKTETSLHYENLVRQEWTSEITIDAWGHWAKEQAIHCQPLTDALIKHAELSEGLRVLDLAAGVGQPSFSIAKKVGPAGRVIATDLSRGMLGIAERRAREANLDNIDCQVADAHELPFADNAFDRVVSRLGLMYFWDINKAISEIHRVLKPGGIASFIVWGAVEQSPFFAGILSPFTQRREMPMLPDDAPTPTRFGDASGLIEAFRAQKFSRVEVKTYCEPLPWPGTPKELFHHFYDMAAPMQPYIDSFKDEEKKAAILEVEQNFEIYKDGAFTRVPASFNAICLTK